MDHSKSPEWHRWNVKKITKWQTLHSIIKIGKDLQDHLVQPSTITPCPLKHVPQCHCLITLSEKKFFPIFNLNLPWHNVGLLPPILLLLHRRRGQSPHQHSLLSGRCREQWGLSWASSSPASAIPVPSAALCKFLYNLTVTEMFQQTWNSTPGMKARESGSLL